MAKENIRGIMPRQLARTVSVGAALGILAIGCSAKPASSEAECVFPPSISDHIGNTPLNSVDIHG